MVVRKLVVAGAVLVCLLAALPAEAGAPKRVVAITPFAANVLASIGPLPIAVGETPVAFGGSPRGTEQYSGKLRGVKRLPLSHPSGPNLEQLAVLNPDLVLSSPTWRKGHQGMKELEIRVAESEPRSVRSVPIEVRQIGDLVDREQAASRLGARIRSQTLEATEGIRGRPRVLMVLGVGRTPFAFLPNSFGGDVVRRAGGRLLTRGLTNRGGFARISDEVVLARNPDVIIAVPHGQPEDISETARYLKSNPAWRSTNAVRSNRVYVSTDNSLLQASTDVGSVIRRVRARYLKNLSRR